LKLTSIWLLIIFTLQMLFSPLSIKAEAKVTSVVSKAADEIVQHMLREAGAQSVQELIDKKLTAEAGLGAEWTVIALSQRGNYDFSAYEAKLREYLRSKDIKAAVTRQKYAFALASAGSNDPFIRETLDATIGNQGVMSWVYGLHLLHNGFDSSHYTIASVADKLLSLQLEDGGWALMGKRGDVDVTAMTVQALAPLYHSDANVRNAVDRALLLLSGMQMEDGCYSSFGTPNPESAAQVLIALSALGIDGLSDERFIKNGKTLLDGMLRFSLGNGAFVHVAGGAENANASNQVLFALTAYQRHLSGRPSVYLLDSERMTDKAHVKTALGYKEIAVICILCAAMLACALLLALKKRHPKNLAFVAVITAIAAAFVLTTDFQSADSYYSGEAMEKKHPVGHVTLSIRCDAVADRNGENVYIPADGTILDKSTFAIDEGDTVYTVLTDAAREKGLHLETSGPAGMVYVEGIAYLYEFAFGDLSGWVYSVNGQHADAGCDQYRLKNGDEILWQYSLQMGNDL